MNRNLKRLEALEAANSTKPLGFLSFLYAHDEAEFARQKAALIAEGHAEFGDWWFWDAMPASAPKALFVRSPITRTHDERVCLWAK